MTDIISPENRSRIMASIKGKDTKPEIIVRKYLFSRGLRFRVHVKRLPGNPDIVLKKYRTVIFVNGCFWHGHERCRHYRLPQSNVDFWRQKIHTNQARDYRHNVELRLLGWRVITVWECEIKNVSDRERVLSSIYDKIVGIKAGYTSDDNHILTAAEETPEYGDKENQ